MKRCNYAIKSIIPHLWKALHNSAFNLSLHHRSELIPVYTTRSAVTVLIWFYSQGITIIFGDLAILIRGATVTKWGNSLALRIPQRLAAQLGVMENSNVSLRIEGKGRLVIERELSIEEMLESFTEENRHELVDFGPPVGKKVILAYELSKAGRLD